MKFLSIIVFLIMPFSFAFSQSPSVLKKTKHLIYNKKKYEKATNLLNVFIKYDTTNTEAYLQRAMCMRYMGQYGKAFADIYKSIQLDSNNCKSFSELGAIYIMTNKIDLALEAFNQSLRIDSTFSTAYNGRGATYYYYFGENEKALCDFNKAIKYNPKNYSAYFNRGIIYRLKDEDLKAIKDYSTSLKIMPKDYQVLFDRGMSYYRIDKCRKAIKDFSNAIKHYNTKDPYVQLKTGEFYYWRGLCFEELGKTNKAQMDFDRAKKLGFDEKKEIE